MCGGGFSEVCVVFKVQQQLDASRVVLALRTVLNTSSVKKWLRLFKNAVFRIWFWIPVGW